MAEQKKLAGTFRASYYTFEVPFGKRNAAQDRLKELGLLPRFSSLGTGDMVVLSVAIPESKDNLAVLLDKELNPFGGGFISVSEKMDFICPVDRQSILLTRMGTVDVRGDMRFVASAETEKEANVGQVNDVYEQVFRGMVELAEGFGRLTVNQLEETVSDRQVLAVLLDRADSKLAYLFDIIIRQKGGESGTLLLQGRANKFYISGSDGNLYAVEALWHTDSRYWLVRAFPAWTKGNSPVGSLVFSR